MFFDNLLQPSHLLIVLAVALIVLGPKRLPEVGHALGRGLRDFRDAISGDHHDDHPELASPEVHEFSEAPSPPAPLQQQQPGATSAPLQQQQPPSTPAPLQQQQPSTPPAPLQQQQPGGAPETVPQQQPEPATAPQQRPPSAATPPAPPRPR